MTTFEAIVRLINRQNFCNRLQKNVQTLAKMKDDDIILIEFQEIHCNYSHYLVIIHGGLLYGQRKRKEDATNISLFDFNADDIW